MGHVLMENRNGIAVAGDVTQATGTAERETALDLIDLHRPGEGRMTLGGDKGFDVEGFVQALRQRKVTPHIAIDGHLTKTGKRRNLGTFSSRRAAEQHERAIQYFKRA